MDLCGDGGIISLLIQPASSVETIPKRNEQMMNAVKDIL
jgi:hypothetical protein